MLQNKRLCIRLESVRAPRFDRWRTLSCHMQYSCIFLVIENLLRLQGVMIIEDVKMIKIVRDTAEDEYSLLHARFKELFLTNSNLTL